MTSINQKEYLKKYLGIGKGSNDKKKKKKKVKSLAKGLKIVDDDIDILLNQEIQEDLNANNDEAPQIVSVIDDRPPSLRIDEETQSILWKPIGQSDQLTNSKSTIKYGGGFKLSNPAFERNTSLGFKTKLKKSSALSKKESLPPPTPTERESEDLLSTKDEIHRPLNKKVKEEIESENDASPLRRDPHCDKYLNLEKNRNNDNSFSDQDIPLKKNRNSKEEDNSPPRRSKNVPHRGDYDISPPRRLSNKRDLSPLTKRKDQDNSPPRRKKSDDMSPPRKKRPERRDYSPINSHKTDKGESMSLRKTAFPVRKKSRWGKDEEVLEKMKKTLDGKTAGLQKADELVNETLELKKREDALFKNMSAEISGVNAATIVRHKHVKDIEKEERKRKKDAENKEKYDRWGKGLKQVEDINARMAEDLHEMSKPLARYADDSDLEKYLKEQERAGDPMLAYIKKKKRKMAINEGVPVKQQYEGDSAPNRFGIRPGYRWDGVDRSNGYEKKWFEVQNSRKANIEESYKWSTEDM